MVIIDKFTVIGFHTYPRLLLLLLLHSFYIAHFLILKLLKIITVGIFFSPFVRSLQGTDFNQQQYFNVYIVKLYLAELSPMLRPHSYDIKFNITYLP